MASDAGAGTEGFMEKKGEHMGAGYKQRYFRLEKDKLCYYADKTDSDRKGFIDLSTGPTVRFSDDKNQAAVGPREIQIVTATRTYRLRCESTPTARRWISGLRRAVTAMANPTADVSVLAREQSFRGLVARDTFKDLIPPVAYRCKWSATEPGGAGVWDSAVRDEIGDEVVRRGEVVDAVGISDDTSIGACLRLSAARGGGYVQVSSMEPVVEMRMADFMDSLGRGGDRANGAASGVKCPSVRMDGRLMLLPRVGSGARFPNMYEDEQAVSYQLRGCRLEALTPLSKAMPITKAELEGFVCQVQCCCGSEVDAELQKASGERYWVTLTAPDAAAATEWTLALTAGRSPIDDDSLPDGSKWLRDTKNFDPVPAPNLRENTSNPHHNSISRDVSERLLVVPVDVLGDPKTSSTGERVDALYNQSHMKSVSFAIEFWDNAQEGGRLSRVLSDGRPVSARFHARQPWNGGLRPWSRLFETEEAAVRKSDEGQRRCGAAFSVMLGVNTRWDELGLELMAGGDVIGNVLLTISELRNAQRHEVIRTVAVADSETRDLRWESVDSCDTELLMVDVRLIRINDQLRRLVPAGGEGGAVAVAAAAAPVVDAKPQVADMMLKLRKPGVDDETRRKEQQAQLTQEKAELQIKKDSLEECRTIRMQQEALQVQCRIVAFFHPEPERTSFGASDKYAQLVAVQRYLLEYGYAGVDVPRGCGRRDVDTRNVRNEALMATEQLLVPLSALEVPIAFLEETIRFRRDRLRRQHDLLRDHVAADNGLHRISAQMSTDYWTGMLPLYQECLGFYKTEQENSRPPRALPAPLEGHMSCAIEPDCWARLMRYWLLQLHEAPLFAGELFSAQSYDASIRSPPATMDELDKLLATLPEDSGLVIKKLCAFLASPLMSKCGTNAQRREKDVPSTTSPGETVRERESFPTLDHTYLRFIPALFGRRGEQHTNETNYLHALVALFSSEATPVVGKTDLSLTTTGSVDSTSAAMASMSGSLAGGSTPVFGDRDSSSNPHVQRSSDKDWLDVAAGGPTLDGVGRGLVAVDDHEVEMEMVRNTLKDARLKGPFFDMSLADLWKRDGSVTKFFNLCIDVLEKLGGQFEDVYAHQATDTQIAELQELKKCVDRYNEPISRAVLKPSSLKKNRAWGFVATNLCVQQMMLTTEADAEANQSIPAFVAVTAGCAAAHTHGFAHNSAKNPPRKNCGIRLMEEKLAELQLEAMRASEVDSEGRTAMEKNDWQIRQRGMNFLSGIKQQLYSAIWRLKVEDTLYTLHLYHHGDELSVRLYIFGPNGMESSRVFDETHTFETDFAKPIEARIADRRADLRFQGHLWTLSVLTPGGSEGEQVHDWLSEEQNANTPHENEIESFNISRVEVTLGFLSQAGDQKHVVYDVRVMYGKDGAQVTELEAKRYSEFEQLVKLIGSAVHGNSVLHLPPLPSKTFKIQFNWEFVQKRALALQEWCNRVKDVPRIATNPHYLVFFGLLEAPDGFEAFGSGTDSGMGSPMSGVESSPRVILGQSRAELPPSASLLAMTQSDVRTQHRVLHKNITELSLRIEGRRDVALSQALSILVTSFFATLQGAAAGASATDGGAIAALLMNQQSRQNLRLLERMGFCIAFESLLTTFGKECRMIEDLDAAVKLLNGVKLVCTKGKAGARNRCDRIRRLDKVGDDETTWMREGQEKSGGLGTVGEDEDEVADNPLQAEPEPEVEEDDAEDWTTMVVEVTLAPECFALIDEAELAKIAEGNARVIDAAAEAWAAETVAAVQGAIQSQSEPEPVPEPAAEQEGVEVPEGDPPQRLSLSCYDGRRSQADRQQMLRHTGMSSLADQQAEEEAPAPEASTPPAVRSLRVRALLFTQGVNEQQSMAARVGAKRDLGLQDEINRHSVHQGKAWYRDYKALVVELCDKRAVLAHSLPREQELESLQVLDRMIDQLATAVNRSDGVNTKELNVLTTAASFCRALGFARVTHCKSGKDRTSMSVTLEQCAVVEQELLQKGNFALDEATPSEQLRNVMRTHGVRREGVRCNTSMDIYAFNPMQRSTLPAELQPPQGCYKSVTGAGPKS